MVSFLKNKCQNADGRKNREYEVLNNVTMKPEFALSSVNTKDYLITVGLKMHETLKKRCSHKLKIFLIPLSISELTKGQNFLLAVWPKLKSER